METRKNLGVYNMLTIPTVVKQSKLNPERLGCFVSCAIKQNSIIVEKQKEFGVIELSNSQFKEVMNLIISLPGEEQKRKLLKISDLFSFDRNNRILPISNIAYLNSSDSSYNVQYINGVLYSTRDIQNGEELICSVSRIIEL